MSGVEPFAEWVPFTVRLPAAEYKYLQRMKAKGQSIGDTVAEAIRAWRKQQWPSDALGLNLQARERQYLITMVDFLRRAPKDDKELALIPLKWWRKTAASRTTK
jgi:hypothetical protein